jgi:hypothetical protein
VHDSFFLHPSPAILRHTTYVTKHPGMQANQSFLLHSTSQLYSHAFHWPGRCRCMHTCPLGLPAQPSWPAWPLITRIPSPSMRYWCRVSAQCFARSHQSAINNSRTRWRLCYECLVPAHKRKKIVDDFLKKCMIAWACTARCFCGILAPAT